MPSVREQRAVQLGKCDDLDILKKMGTTMVEPSFAGMGLARHSCRRAAPTSSSGGMFILPKPCRNVLLTDPIAKDTGGPNRAEGRPERTALPRGSAPQGPTSVTGPGWDTVATAKKIGIPEDKTMQVAGKAENVQAITVGRADTGRATTSW